jgi:type VI secretion system ImpB/VipA family protein
MSNSSYQSEIPKARINLKLDLHTGGASKKTELPLKLLVAGDFSHGQESASLSERKKVNLNKNNFDSVLSEYSPKVNLTVKNTLAGDGSEDNISLTFQSMKDFTPEQVSRQIPQLKAMLSMRNLLRDLKANLLDNQAFRKELEKILLDPELSAELRTENAAGGESVVLERPAAGGVYASLFEKINLNPVSELSALDIWQDAQAMSDATADERLTAGMQVFLECLTKSGSKVEKLDKNLIDHHIAELDYQISRQLDAVMHHEDFQAVESLWRGVKSLVDKTDFRQNVKVELLDMSKEDLRQDFEDSPEIIQSGLYKQTYIDEYDTPGGEPIAALICAGCCPVAQHLKSLCSRAYAVYRLCRSEILPERYHGRCRSHQRHW